MEPRTPGRRMRGRALLTFERRRRRASAVAALLGLLFAGSSSGAQGLEVGMSFEGSDMNDEFLTFPEDQFIKPPDTVAAVGEEEIVELTNNRYAVYRKSDGALLQESGIQKFWSDSGAYAFWNEEGTHEAALSVAFDPRVIYDATSQRWFACGGERTNPFPSSGPLNHLLFAASNTSDPTQGWTGFSIARDPGDATFIDFPSLGVNADGVFLEAARYAEDPDERPIGRQVVAIPKSDLLGPAPTVANATIFLYATSENSLVNAQPVVDLEGGGHPEILLSGSYSFLGEIQLSEVDGPITAPTYGNARYVAVDAMPWPVDAEQPGPKRNLGAQLDESVFSTSAIRRNGKLWAVQSVLDDNGHDAVRWLQIDAENGIVLQSGVIEDSALDLIYPSIAVNEFDEVVIGMTGTAETQFPSAYAVAGKTVNGVTSFGALLLLAAGVSDYDAPPRFPGIGLPPSPINRWGDYSATVVDPSDPHWFWTFQEYVVDTDAWGTRIVRLHFVPEGQVDLLAGVACVTLAAMGRCRRSRSVGASRRSGGVPALFLNRSYSVEKLRRALVAALAKGCSLAAVFAGASIAAARVNAALGPGPIVGWGAGAPPPAVDGTIGTASTIASGGDDHGAVQSGTGRLLARRRQAARGATPQRVRWSATRRGPVSMRTPSWLVAAVLSLGLASASSAIVLAPGDIVFSGSTPFVSEVYRVDPTNLMGEVVSLSLRGGLLGRGAVAVTSSGMIYVQAGTLVQVDPAAFDAADPAANQSVVSSGLSTAFGGATAGPEGSVLLALIDSVVQVDPGAYDPGNPTANQTLLSSGGYLSGGTSGIAYDPATGGIFVTLYFINTVVRIDPGEFQPLDPSANQTVVAQDGLLVSPHGIAREASGTLIVACGDADNPLIVRVDPIAFDAGDPAANQTQVGVGWGRPVGVAVEAEGRVVVATEGGSAVQLEPDAFDIGNPTGNQTIIHSVGRLDYLGGVAIYAPEPASSGAAIIAMVALGVLRRPCRVQRSKLSAL